MGRGYVIVEGQGEVEAVLNLLTRLWYDLGLPYAHWAQPLRWRGLHLEQKAREACRIVRARGDADMLLVLRDADLDDDCPMVRGPEAAAWLRSEVLPFPAAVALLHKEYETLFLPCLPLMAAKTWCDERGNERGGFPDGTAYDGNPEQTRGIKEWLSDRLPRGRSYKPTLDQLPLTRMLDFVVLRQSGLPCFGTLERAVRFLGTHLGQPGGVYPLEHDGFRPNGPASP